MVIGGKFEKNMSSRIILALNNAGEGLTNGEILKSISCDDTASPQLINHYLKEMTKLEVLIKYGTKYELKQKTFIINGTAVAEFQNRLVIMECPYYGTDCKRCHNGNDTPCLFTQNLPESIKGIFGAKKN